MCWMLVHSVVVARLWVLVKCQSLVQGDFRHLTPATVTDGTARDVVMTVSVCTCQGSVTDHYASFS